MIQPGDTFLERFEIQQIAGRGGMGVVYRALDMQSNETVALKLIEKDAASAALRFAREAWVLSGLAHPSIVKYVAHGETPDGQVYLAMEWLEGEDLSQRLSRGPLSTEESVCLVTRMSQALAVIHGRGIVHRDVKPSNIFLPYGNIEEAKLLDFGIAHLSEPLLAMTKTGALLGTPGYMSPEQARGSKDLDARTDIFALGCVLFQCATGRPAFLGEHVMAVLAKILFEEPPPPSQLRAGSPVFLDVIVQKMLAKDPSLRFKSCEEILASLQTQEIQQSSILTQIERRLFCLLMIRELPPPTQIEGDAPTVESSHSPGLEAIQRICAPYGGRPELLVDGSLAVALFSNTGEGATDQAFRASRLAIALRESLPAHSLALTMGRGEETRLPIGEVIDRAARLLSHHFDGANIFTDELSAILIGGLFELQEREGAYILLREKKFDEPARTLLGRPTPCVGRERELANIEALFDETISEPVARAVLVTAAAGVGKSRFSYELIQRIDQRPEVISVWIGRGSPLLMASPCRLLLQVIQKTAGIGDGEPPDTSRKKLSARLSRHLPSDEIERVTTFFGEQLGLLSDAEGGPALQAARQDPKLMSEHILRAWEDWFRAECRAQPVLLVLEDLHWSDPDTIRVVHHLLRHLAELPLMVLALARPEVHDLFPRLWLGCRVEELKLSELTKKASEKLIRYVLGTEVSAEVVEQLIKRSAGNAFYLEELCRATSQGQLAFPESIVAMAGSRIERLPSDARRVLRAASIFGEVFWSGGLHALLGKELLLGGILEYLLAQEFITSRRGSRFLAEDEYLFRHAFLQEAAYSMLTESDKVLGHRLAGEWLVSAGEQPAVLAEHFERAKENSRAAYYYQQTAERLLKGSYSAQGTLALYQKACSLLPSNNIDRFQLHAQSARLLAILGQTSEREREVCELLKLAEQFNEASLIAKAYVEKARLESDANQRSAAKQTLEKAISFARQANDIEIEAEAMRLEAELLVDMGDFPGGLATIKLALEKLGSAPERRILRAVALKTFGILHRRSGNVSEAMRLYQEALPLAQEENDRVLEGQLYNNLGVAAQITGRLEESLHYLKRGLALDQEVGNRASTGIKLGNIGQIYLELGDISLAIDFLQQGQKCSAAVNELGGLADSFTHLAHAFLREGEVERARAFAEDALKTAKQDGRLYFIGHAQLALASCLLASPNELARKQAYQLGTDTLNLGESASVPDLQSGSLWVLAKLAFLEQNFDSAQRMIHQAFSIIQSHPYPEKEQEFLLLQAQIFSFTNKEMVKDTILRAFQIVQHRAEQITDIERRRIFLQTNPQIDVVLLAKELNIGFNF